VQQRIAAEEFCEVYGRDRAWSNLSGMVNATVDVGEVRTTLDTPPEQAPTMQKTKSERIMNSLTMFCLCMLPGIVMLPIGLSVKGVTSNATPFEPLSMTCKITAVQHFLVGKDDSCKDKGPPNINSCDCMSCENSGYPESNIPGSGDIGFHRLFCKDFYTYTFNNGQDTGLKSVECSCRRLWDECKVNSTSQTPPRYQVGSDAQCWKPRTTPLSGPTPPIPECGDGRCYQTSDPTVKVSQMDKYGTDLMIAGFVMLPIALLCAAAMYLFNDSVTKYFTNDNVSSEQ
jgi:hypothetical protein